MAQLYSVINDTSLQHHGIKGQKWGVRRFQNYDGTRIKSGTANSNTQNRRFDNTKSGWSDLDTDAQTAIIQTGLVATLAVVLKAAEVAAQKATIKKFDSELETMKQENDDFKSLKDLPIQKPKTDTTKNMAKVNPDYPNSGSTQNCMLCTTAMVMREKGYNVSANKISHGLYEQNIDKMWSQEGKFQKIKAKKSVDIVNHLATEPDGAYGNLTFRWNLGGGHSVFWKKENGKVHIYDGQMNKEYSIKSQGDLLPYISGRGAQYSRLDNATPNELLLAAVKSA